LAIVVGTRLRGVGGFEGVVIMESQGGFLITRFLSLFYHGKYPSEYWIAEKASKRKAGVVTISRESNRTYSASVLAVEWVAMAVINRFDKSKLYD